MEKIIVAFEDEKNARHIRDMVENAGVATVQLCRSGMEVRRLLGQEPISTVVCGYKLSDGSAEALFDDLPAFCSMLMIATKPQLELCLEGDIFKLAAPVHRAELIASVTMLLQIGSHLERFIPPRRNESDRAVIEEAKRLLADRYGMTEAEAHRFLQKQSMDTGSKMVQTARLVLGERL